MSKGTSRKKSEQVERRYIKEFAYKVYPNALWIGFEVPITPIPPAFRRQFPSASPKSFTRYRRHCDAVIITETEILLVEAKIRRPIDGLGQLLLYRHYAPTAEAVKRWHPRTIVPVIVSPKNDPFLIPVCASNGFRYIIYETNKSVQYLTEKGFVLK